MNKVFSKLEIATPHGQIFAWSRVPGLDDRTSFPRLVLYNTCYGAGHIIPGSTNSPLRLTEGSPIIVSSMKGSRNSDMQQCMVQILCSG